MQRKCLDDLPQCSIAHAPIHSVSDHDMSQLTRPPIQLKAGSKANTDRDTNVEPRRKLGTPLNPNGKLNACDITKGAYPDDDVIVVKNLAPNQRRILKVDGLDQGNSVHLHFHQKKLPQILTFDEI